MIYSPIFQHAPTNKTKNTASATITRYLAINSTISFSLFSHKLFGLCLDNLGNNVYSNISVLHLCDRYVLIGKYEDTYDIGTDNHRLH